MIQFHQVKKEYNDNDFVLGELNFHIDEGEFVFLIGPSGSGKTSIIKLLIREENLSNGKIFFDDYDITRITRDSIYKLRRYVGVIFQDYKLIADKTVEENVAFAMEVAGKSNKEIRDTVPYLLDIVGLSHRADAFPDYLSGGEKQRVAIARAVSNNPRVLIADEPTGNLDPAAAWDIVQILSKINNWGTTVIMSTHGTDIVNTLNKRVIQMQGGQIVRDDRKGAYEVSRTSEKTDEEKIDLESENVRTGPIRVRIKAVAQGDQQPEAKKGLFAKIWPFGATEDDGLVTPLEEEFGQEVDHEIAKKEYVKDVDDELKKVPKEEVETVLEDADRTPVEKLDLQKQVIADLKIAGYNDVEDLISAGPEKLSEELIIDPEEIVLVARALTKFIGEEDKKWKKMTQKSAKKSEEVEEVKEEPKTEKKSSPKKVKPQVDLTHKPKPKSQKE